MTTSWPSRIGRYEILAILGEGATGVVYRAMDATLGREVAIKVLRDSVAARDAHRKRFLREAQACARIDHPNIVVVHEVGDFEGRAFLVMEFVNGKPLSAVLQDGTSDLRTLVSLLEQAARGLAAAHARGIVHRDVKPGNILVTREGNAKVADFGLAHIADALTHLTRTGAVLGTPRYMAPEQLQGKGDRLSPSVDVYALGVILYEMLAGVPPHSGRTATEATWKALWTDPEPPSRKNARVPQELEAVCLKALARSPMARYPHAGALAADVQRWLKGEPVHAKPVTTVRRIVRKLAHRPGTTAATAASLALLVVAAMLTVTMIRSEAHRRSSDAALARERDRAAAQSAAQETNRRALLELQTLRLRTYRPDFRMIDSDYARLERLSYDCRTAMEKTGESADGWFIVGRVHHVCGRVEEAERAYEAGLRVDPNHGPCNLYLARILIDRAIRLRFSTAMGEADRHERLERSIERALTLLETATARGQVEPIEADLAKAYERVVRREETREFCAAMLEKWKGADFRDEFLLARGLGNPSTLLADLDEAIRTRPRYSTFWFWRGANRREARDFDGAIEAFSLAIDIDPRFTDAYVQRGYSSIARRDYQAAIRDFDKAIEMNSRLVGAYTGRGIARKEAGDLNGATADYSVAIALRPQWADLHALRGFVRGLLDDLAGSVEDYSEAIKIDPTLTEAYANRAAAYLGMNRVEEAIADSSRAIELDPASVGAHFNRARALTKKGELDAAIADFTTVLSLDASHAHAYYGRSIAWIRKENLAHAASDLEAALRHAPKDWDHRAKAQAALDQIRSKLNR